MKRTLFLITAIMLCMSFFSGCGGDMDEPFALLPKEDGIIGVAVSSLPEGYHYSFSGDDVDAIVEYLSNMNLISDFSENPNEYLGATWVISIEYENGDIATVYHMGNMFIRTNNGPWYKMNYDDANRFELLLDELNS